MSHSLSRGSLLSYPFYLAKDIFLHPSVLISMVRYDFRSRYIGNHFGLIWVFVNPFIMVTILWVVFSVGLKAKPAGDTPFVIWLLSGMIPWLFIADILNSTTPSIIQQAYLVKKVEFNLSLLPLVKMGSGIIVHLIMLCLLVIILLSHGFFPTLYWLQLPYYIFSTCIILFGITLLTASVSVFFRDMIQIMGISIQFGFWLTPIFWDIKLLPEKFRFWISLNPAQYIIQGYRDIFIDHVWFWERTWSTGFFWAMSMLTFFFGAFVFRRLRPHFADAV